MGRAVVDANVLLGAFSKRDAYHEEALAIVRDIDRRELPEGVVPAPILPEVLNPAQKREGRSWAVETLERMENSSGFEITHIPQGVHSTGLARWRGLSGEDGAEFTDAVIVSYMRSEGIEHIYSFDDDFDEFDDVTRLNAAVNPFDA